MSSSKLRFALPLAGVLGLAIASLAIAGSQDHGKRNGNGWGKDRNTFTAVLSGRNEVPAIHTKATGRLSLTINSDNTMSFELTYSASPPQRARRTSTSGSRGRTAASRSSSAVAAASRRVRRERRAPRP